MLGERSSAIVYPCLAFWGAGAAAVSSRSGAEGTRALIARYAVCLSSTQPGSEFHRHSYLSAQCFDDEAFIVFSYLSLRSLATARGAGSRVLGVILG